MKVIATFEAPDRLEIVPVGSAAPFASVNTPRRVPPFQGPTGTSPSIAHDPFGECGLYSTDPRYGWHEAARCYAMVCESCRVEFAAILDEEGFYVCLGCKGGGR